MSHSGQSQISKARQIFSKKPSSPPTIEIDCNSVEQVVTRHPCLAPLALCPVCDVQQLQSRRSEFSCGHSICMACYKLWVAVISYCPVCHAFLTQATHHLHGNQKTELIQFNSSEQCQVCRHCHNPHTFIACVGCSHAKTHSYCQPNAQEEWLCRECRVESSKDKPKRKKKWGKSLKRKQTL